MITNMNFAMNGAKLTVTAPAGVTVTVSKDGKTKTKVADASGVAVFKRLSTGTWTLTITDGEQTAQKTVTITADYEESISFFSATINVTYPAGSTCTATDGVTTISAPDTSGTWACVVPNAGTWTVSLGNGLYEDVTVTENGASYILDKWHIFREGKGAIAPWFSVFGGYSTVTIDENGIVFNYTSIGSSWAGAGTKNSCDLSSYNSIFFDMVVTEHYNMFGGTAVVGVTSSAVSIVQNGQPTFAAKTNPTVDGERRTISVDISSVNSGYISAYGIMKATIYNVWLE